MYTTEVFSIESGTSFVTPDESPIVQLLPVFTKPEESKLKLVTSNSDIVQVPPRNEIIHSNDPQVLEFENKLLLKKQTQYQRSYQLLYLRCTLLITNRIQQRITNFLQLLVSSLISKKILLFLRWKRRLLNSKKSIRSIELYLPFEFRLRNRIFWNISKEDLKQSRQTMCFIHYLIIRIEHMIKPYIMRNWMQ